MKYQSCTRHARAAKCCALSQRGTALSALYQATQLVRAQADQLLGHRARNAGHVTVALSRLGQRGAPDVCIDCGHLPYTHAHKLLLGRSQAHEGLQLPLRSVVARGVHSAAKRARRIHRSCVSGYRVHAGQRVCC